MSASSPPIKNSGNWLTYSRNYSGQRYSPLDQINAANVSKLHIAWMRQVDETDAFETWPLAVDGVLYISEPPNVVEALDAVTGRVLWQYRKEIPSDFRGCCVAKSTAAASPSWATRSTTTASTRTCSPSMRA